MFENINRLVTKEDYGLRAWDDRYSKGVWVCIAPVSALLEEIEDASDAGDLDMIPAMDFVDSVSWLPFVTGNNLIDAMSKLEALLKALPEEDTKRKGAWSYAVTEVLEHMRDVSDQSTGYGDCEGQYRELSHNYNQVWKPC